MKRKRSTESAQTTEKSKGEGSSVEKNGTQVEESKGSI